MIPTLCAIGKWWTKDAKKKLSLQRYKTKTSYLQDNEKCARTNKENIFRIWMNSNSIKYRPKLNFGCYLTVAISSFKTREFCLLLDAKFWHMESTQFPVSCYCLASKWGNFGSLYLNNWKRYKLFPFVNQ